MGVRSSCYPSQEAPKPDPAPDELRGSTVTRYAPDGTWEMPLNNGPCRTWPIDPTCSCFDGKDLPDGPPWPRELERSVEIATELLWRQTAGRYGLCWEMVRPCPAPGPALAPRGGLVYPDPHGTAPPSRAWGSLGGGPGWYGLCGCGGSCGCGPSTDMQLQGPVWQDLSRDYPHGRLYTLDVFIDGIRIPDEDSRLLDGGYLVPVGHSWPWAQDRSRPATPEPEHDPADLIGTWGIRYWRGLPVPAGGVQAVTTLACELWKSCTDDDSCKLPRGVTDIDREGVSYTLVDQGTDLTANMPEIGAWVQSVNPYGIKEQSFVVSPDLPRWYSESRFAPVWSRHGRGWR